VPIVSAATASTIASDVFMRGLLWIFVTQDHLELERDSDSSFKMMLWRLPQWSVFLAVFGDALS
jgi:hypothetical protein